MTPVCDCDRRGDPLASFCDDDLYCPQCGVAVAGLTSPNLQPGPGEGGPLVVWVYPAKARDGSGRLEFRFTLGLTARDAARSEQRQPLLLDAERCAVRLDAWFDKELEVRPEGDLADGVRECVLRPRPTLVAGLYRVLPPEGACGLLVLAGSCGDQSLPLRVFNPPSFRFAVEGDSVQAVPPGAEAPVAWSLGRPGLQELVLRVWPVNCLLYLPRPHPGAASPDPVTPRFAPESDFHLLDPPDRGVILGPERPAVLRMTFDISGWQHGDPETLWVQLAPDVPRLPHEVLTFSRQAQGDLHFEPGAELRLESVLYYGERIESPSDPPSELLPPVQICNRGDDLLRTHQPEVVVRLGPAGVDWLRARVAGGDVIVLDLEEARTLHLVLDLTGVTPENHPEGEPLSAELRFEHLEYGQLSWTMQVVVPEVRVRPALEGPLAIDFGNANTFAAIVDPEAPGRIRAVLGHPNPEVFPTALCFTDPARQQFEIGTVALQRGGVGARDERHEGMLVRGMKRELSRRRTAGEPEKHTFTWKGRAFRFSRLELIRMFLERVLRDCERKRRGTVTHLGLSYPANFSPRARAQLDQVIAELRAQWQAEHPALRDKIRFEPLNADEATAVALGFVFDRAHSDPVIRDLLEAGTNPFLIASFDFGGGSIDCALIRFYVEGDLEGELTYRTEPLGIGGDEFFGGDNVTAAVYERLRARLLAALEPLQVGLPLTDLGRSRFLTGVGLPWENTQRLWDAAEEIKRIVFDPQATGDEHAVLETLVNRLRGQRLVDGALKTQLLMADPDVTAALMAAIDNGALAIPAAEIYDHEIRRDLNGNSGYTVRARLRDCVEKLRGFVQRARAPEPEPGNPGPEGPPDLPTAPHIIVLAGAACRVPLAIELLDAAFPAPATRMIRDLEHAKSKVAFGLVRYLDMLQNFPDQVAGVGLARDFTHADIVWCRNDLDPSPRTWIPSCSPLHGSAWFPLTRVKLARSWKSNTHRTLTVHRDTSPVPEVLGWFDLKEPGRPIEPDVEPLLPPGPPPDPAKDRPQVWLRLVGAEDKLQLRVELDGRSYGIWESKPPIEPAP